MTPNLLLHAVFPLLRYLQSRRRKISIEDAVLRAIELWSAFVDPQAIYQVCHVAGTGIAYLHGGGQQFQALFWEWQVAVDMLHQQPDSMFAIFPNQ